MRRTIATLTALLLCLALAVLPSVGLGEDEELSYELANDLPTGIEEDDEPSYEIAHDLPTGIEEDDEPSYELAHDLPTGIEEWTAYVKTANGKGLKMRAEPNTRGHVIITIPYGAQVRVTGYYNRSWVTVIYGNNNGYCMLRYLSDAKPAAGGSSAQSNPAASVVSSTDVKTMFSSFQSASYSAMVVPSTPTGYVNLRWAPTKSAPTQAVYRSGDIVSVLAVGNGWSQLYDAATGVSGFMMSQFLTRIQQ